MLKRAFNFTTSNYPQIFHRLYTMVSHHTVNGYDEFVSFTKSLNKSEVYFFLYTGSKTDEGKSWCPDCITADPIIESAIPKLPKGSHFVTVFVGDRTTWKDRNCSFRNDPNTKLMVIPTLVRWKGPQKLEGDQCAKKELIEMLFADEEE